MIEVLVKWDSEVEVETAIYIRNLIEKPLRRNKAHSGIGTNNIPLKTLGIRIRDDFRFMYDRKAEEWVSIGANNPKLRKLMRESVPIK